jgi:glycosyltransferase involved in cell wall biosynthesis
MHLVYVLTRSDQFSGPQVHLRELALALRERGDRATVLVGGSGVFTDELARCGVPHRSLRHLVAPIRPWRDALAFAELRRTLRELRPDLVSTHSSKAGVVGRLAARSLGLPVLHTAHGWAFTRRVAAPVRRFYVLWERLAGRCGDHVITVSDYDRQVALEEGVVRDHQVTTVHNGVADVAAELRADAARQPPRLVMVARMERQKDHATLLRALARLRDLPWTLELVGDGPTRGGVEELVGELGLADRVRLLGSRLDVPERLARAQVFVLVSLWEGFPRSILEAMRAGLPVVATDVAGVGEAVGDGVSGLLVKRGDAAALSSSLRRLLADAELRAAMGRAGRRRYEERFTARHLRRSTLEVYRRLLLRRRGKEEA